MRKAIVVLAVVVLVAAFGGTRERVDEARPAAPDGVVEVRNVAGSVRLRGWERNEVAVQGRLGLGERLELTGRGNLTVVRVVVPRSQRDVDGSDLEISLPRGSRVEVKTVSASITLVGVVGVAKLETVSGDVNVTEPGDEVEIETISGRARVLRPIGHVRARSVSGTIDVQGGKGEVKAATVSGGLRVEAESLARCEVETTSGPLELAGALAPEGRVNASSVSGSVHLTLAADANADIEVVTFSGAIDNEFGQKARRTSTHGPGQELAFRLGSGSADVKLRTLSGDVELRKQSR